jgi:hypothetical protein
VWAYTNPASLEVTMHDHTGPHPPRGVAFPATARSGELAAELLDVVNESELESFVGRLVAEAARDAGRRLTPDARRALVAELRSTARRTLPTLEVALGERSRPAGPAAEAAARLFGAELEGMSPEDRDFEIARQFVRFSHERAAAAAARS